MTTFSESRVIDASTINVTDLANVVATLIEDFKKINLIK
jgi:hypothetical protein